MKYEYKLAQFLSIFMVGLLAFGCIGSQPQDQSYAPPVENTLPSDANEQSNQTNMQEQESNESETMVGNDRDEHGCIGSAGYVWCEPLQKCIRPWEEACEAIPVDETGVLPEPQMPLEEQMPPMEEQFPYENEPQMPPMDEPMPPEDFPMEEEPFPDEPPMQDDIMP